MAVNHDQLEEILKHGHAMLRTAENEEWDHLVELQTNRQAMLETYCNRHDEPQESRVQSLRQMLALNQRLIEAVVARRERLAKDLRGFGVSRQALQAYRECDD